MASRRVHMLMHHTATEHHRFFVQVDDIHNTICPVGGVGELWIEGLLLARGYHHDQAKTDASFVVDPPWAAQLPQLQGRRFYRTGDVVRQNAAGEVLYIGREDAQVKIRGPRVKKALPPSLRTVAVTLVLPGGNANNPMLAIAMMERNDITSAVPAPQGRSTGAPMYLHVSHGHQPIGKTGP